MKKVNTQRKAKSTADGTKEIDQKVEVIPKKAVRFSNRLRGISPDYVEIPKNLRGWSPTPVTIRHSEKVKKQLMKPNEKLKKICQKSIKKSTIVKYKIKIVIVKLITLNPEEILHLSQKVKLVNVSNEIKDLHASSMNNTAQQEPNPISMQIDEGYGTGESDQTLCCCTSLHDNTTDFESSFKPPVTAEDVEIENAVKGLKNEAEINSVNCSTQSEPSSSSCSKGVLKIKKDVNTFPTPLRRSTRVRKAPVRFICEDWSEKPIQVKSVKKNLKNTKDNGVGTKTEGVPMSSFVSNLNELKSTHDDQQDEINTKRDPAEEASNKEFNTNSYDVQLKEEIDYVDYLIDNWGEIRLEDIIPSVDFHIDEINLDDYLD